MENMENRRTAVQTRKDTNGKYATYILYSFSREWQKYSKDYTYKKCAENATKMYALLHYKVTHIPYDENIIMAV